MATVHFPSALRQYTGGLDAIAIDAPRVRELMCELSDRFPALADRLEDLAVAIDGQIYHSAAYEKLSPDSEVILLPRIVGG